MPRGKRIEHRDALSAAVAILSGRRPPKTAEQISKMLGVNVKTMQTLRKEAIAKGWLVSTEVFTGVGISQELMSLAEEKIGNKDILPQLAQSLERMAGYPVGVHISNTGSLTQPERQMAAAGLDAAPYLKRLITNPEVSTIAVAYGSTLRCLLDGLRKISPIPIRPDSPITCVPLRGDDY